MKRITGRILQGIIIGMAFLTLAVTSSCSTRGRKVFEIDFQQENRDSQKKLKKEKDRLFTEESVLKISSFDGKAAKTWTIRREEQIKEIKKRLDAMKFKKAETLPEDAVKPPFYGIQIINKEETAYGSWMTDFAWTNGYLVTWDNAVYTGEFDLEQLMEGISAETEETCEGASDFPCANWLLKGENSYKETYLTRALEKDAEQSISIDQAVVYRAADEYMRVVLRINAAEIRQEDVLKRLSGNPLQVKIGADWFSVPTHSRVKSRYETGKNYYGPYSTVNSDRAFDINIPLTARYGNLPAGDYRWDIFRDTGLYINFYVNKYGQMELVESVDPLIMMEVFGGMSYLNSTMDLLVYEGDVIHEYKIAGTKIGQTRSDIYLNFIDENHMPLPSKLPEHGL